MEMVRWVLKNKIVWLTGAFFAFWTPTVIFLGIAGEILEKSPIASDIAILQAIHSYGNTFLDTAFIGITTVGGIESVLSLTVILALWFGYKKQWERLLIVVASVVGAASANIALKSLFQRDRPQLWPSLITETSFSFPSGHAMLSTALVLSLVVVLWSTKFRWWSLAAGVFIIGLVGVSRLYLGVHFPTDIVAGWCASAAWVVVVAATVKGVSYKLHRRARQNHD